MTTREIITVCISLSILILVSVACKMALNSERKKINNAWLYELDRRGYIDRNKAGSFEWKEEK